MKFPVFSYGSYAQDQRGHGQVIAYRVPIEIEGILIRPEDILFGDVDGVLSIPQEITNEMRLSAPERERLSEWQISRARIEYGRKARDYESLLVLSDQPGHVYSVPEAGSVELIHRGLPLDVIEDFLEKSAAYRQARRILFAPEVRAVRVTS